MTLPLLLSVPHAGLQVPSEVQSLCALTAQEVKEDGDVGAAEIYALEDQVAGFVTSPIARAIVDLNRAEDDRTKDGVVKTHTCWDIPVYLDFPHEDVIAELLNAYYRPYHRRLTQLGESGQFVLAIDCHTMAAFGPPVAPDPGEERPWVCLSNADGTCPEKWIANLRESFAAAFDGKVTINKPFRGGYITRTHAAEMPWVQVELSRAPFMTDQTKRLRVLEALSDWCSRHSSSSG